MVVGGLLAVRVRQLRSAPNRANRLWVWGEWVGPYHISYWSRTDLYLEPTPFAPRYVRSCRARAASLH